MTYTETGTEKDGVKFGIRITNITDDELPFVECLFSAITANINEEGNASLFTMGNGLTLGSTAADFINANGLEKREFKWNEETRMGLFQGEEQLAMTGDDVIKMNVELRPESEATLTTGQLETDYDFETGKVMEGAMQYTVGHQAVTFWFDGDPVNDPGATINQIMLECITQ